MPIKMSTIKCVRKVLAVRTDRRLSTCNPKLAFRNLGKDLSKRIESRGFVHKASSISDQTCTLIDKAAYILIFKGINHHRKDPLDWGIRHAIRKCKFSMLLCSSDLLPSCGSVWFKMLDWRHSVCWPKELNQGQVRVLDCDLVAADLKLTVRFLEPLKLCVFTKIVAGWKWCQDSCCPFIN